MPSGYASRSAHATGDMPGILSAVYYGSGYIKRRDLWVLGLVLGVIYMTVYLAIIVKWLEYLGV
jgi:di/tricarboxylate transporter